MRALDIVCAQMSAEQVLMIAAEQTKRQTKSSICWFDSCCEVIVWALCFAAGSRSYRRLSWRK